jgi:hypothetical protein
MSLLYMRAASFAGPTPRRTAAQWYAIADLFGRDGEIALWPDEMDDFIAFAYLNMPYEFWPLRLRGKRVVYRNG